MLAIGNENCEISQLHPMWIWTEFFIWFSLHGCKPIEIGSKIVILSHPEHSVIQLKPPTSTFALFSSKFIYRLNVAWKLVLGFTVSSWSWKTKAKFMQLVLASTWKPSPYLRKFLISLEILYSASWLEFLRRQCNLVAKIWEIAMVNKKWTLICNSCSHTKLCPTLATPWTEACQAFPSFTISWSVLKVMSIESVMPFSCLIHCCHLLLLSFFPSIKVFFRWVGSLHQVAKVLELQLHQSFQWIWRVDFFRINWFDLLAV